MQKFYIIKNTGAWMMDELAAFAESTRFTVFFLRKQDQFYDDNIKLLEKKGINIIYLQNRKSLSFSKLIFCFLFTIRHLHCFFNIHSLVYGIKSLGYFLRTDLKVFKNEQTSVHCQFATQSAILGLMLKEYYSTNVSYSITFHAYDIYVRNLWFNSLAAEADRLFSISNHNIKYVFEHYSIKDKSKIIYSPLGVFPPREIKGNGPSDVLRIGFLSYYVEMKGIKFLLPAIKELKKSGFPFIMNFAGDGPLKNEMVSFVEKYSLSENVKLHGLVKNEEKELFFRNLDVFILPSISIGMKTDGLPVVLMEAVSYGLPVISTNVSGIPEICINDYNGFLIEQKSVSAIVNAIIRFSSESSKWLFFSKNSLEISRHYNITTNSLEKLKMMGWER